MKIKIGKLEITIEYNGMELRRAEVRSIIIKFLELTKYNPIFKIEAIKLYRDKMEQITGEKPGLTDSKDYLDILYNKMGHNVNL